MNGHFHPQSYHFSFRIVSDLRNLGHSFKSGEMKPEYLLCIWQGPASRTMHGRTPWKEKKINISIIKQK
jgi:hypothetical protein